MVIAITALGAAMLLLLAHTAALTRRVARLEARRASGEADSPDEPFHTNPDRLFREWMYGGEA
jgi:hypothetical protein